METLLDEIKQKFDFNYFDKTVITGHSNIIILNKYHYDIKNTEDVEKLKIIISEVHDGKQVIKDCFRLSIFSLEEENEPIDLFTFYSFGKLNRFIQAIVL
jgi:hypothetical protein